MTEVFEQYRETARARGIQFRLAGRRASASFIEIDRLLFKRAISNLVSNAIKNSSSGGVVRGWIRLDGRLRVGVLDTGAGIAPAHREAIFTEYYQTNNPGRDRSKGLGLGLSIVHRVIRIPSGHDLNFASVEGRGSPFRSRRMLSASPLAAAAKKSGWRCLHARSLQDVHAPVRRRTDRPRRSAASFLERGRACARRRVDGRIRTILADDSRIPHLTVTDIRLRNGATGKEVADRIRRHFAWLASSPSRSSPASCCPIAYFATFRTIRSSLGRLPS